ncbi:MAG: HAD family hydrolase [Hyphomicrobiales bacterium]
MIRAVIFDFGNTLACLDPSRPAWRTDYAETIARPGAVRLARRLVEEGALEDGVSASFVARFLEIREANRRRADESGDEITAATSLAESLLAVGAPPLDAARAAAPLRAFFAEEEARIVPLPGATETLAALRARGVPLALLSNATDGSFIERVTVRVGWRAWLDPFVVSADLGVRKPRREAFEAVLGAWPYPPESVAMVGDSLRHDIQGALALGLQTFHLTAVENPGDAALKDAVVPRHRVPTHEALRAALLAALG